MDMAESTDRTLYEDMRMDDRLSYKVVYIFIPNFVSMYGKIGKI